MTIGWRMTWSLPSSGGGWKGQRGNSYSGAK
jgi:hypothetical protein